MKRAVWIVGGTTEGRLLTTYISQFDVWLHVSVATAYGASLLPKKENITVYAKRMEETEMEAFMRQQHIQLVIDATHPYATAVTAHVQAACTAQKIAYWRVVRPADTYVDCVTVDTMEEAVDVLSHTAGTIFLTTGSKNLDVFTQIPDYTTRVYARILPTMMSLKRALDLGYEPSHLICMQGPFSVPLNTAMFSQYNAAYVVTKDSGKPGGFAEKVTAARNAGATLVVIKRRTEQGHSLEDIKQAFQQWYKE